MKLAFIRGTPMEKAKWQLKKHVIARSGGVKA